MLVVFGLVTAGDRFIEINAGTARDLLGREIHIEVQQAPGRMTQNQRRDENFASREDQPGGHDNVTDGPLLIVEVKIMHLSDIRIERGDRVLVQVFRSAQTQRRLLRWAAGFLSQRWLRAE